MTLDCRAAKGKCDNSVTSNSNIAHHTTFQRRSVENIEKNKCLSFNNITEPFHTCVYIGNIFYLLLNMQNVRKDRNTVNGIQKKKLCPEMTEMMSSHS